MFDIIETPRNYFTRELLHDNCSFNVALHFSVSHWRPYLVASYSEEVFCWPSTVLGVLVPAALAQRLEHAHYFHRVVGLVIINVNELQLLPVCVMGVSGDRDVREVIIEVGH